MIMAKAKDLAWFLCDGTLIVEVYYIESIVIRHRFYSILVVKEHNYFLLSITKCMIDY